MLEDPRTRKTAALYLVVAVLFVLPAGYTFGAFSDTETARLAVNTAGNFAGAGNSPTTTVGNTETTTTTAGNAGTTTATTTAGNTAASVATGGARTAPGGATSSTGPLLAAGVSGWMGDVLTATVVRSSSLLATTTGALSAPGVLTVVPTARLAMPAVAGQGHWGQDGARGWAQKPPPDAPGAL